MAPVIEELKDHLVYERDRLNKNTTLPLGVKNFLMESYNKCLVILRDEVLTSQATPVEPPSGISIIAPERGSPLKQDSRIEVKDEKI